MASAQVLKATLTVDDTGRVRGVVDIAISIDNRVAGVGRRRQGNGRHGRCVIHLLSIIHKIV